MTQDQATRSSAPYTNSVAGATVVAWIVIVVLGFALTAELPGPSLHSSIDRVRAWIER